MRERDVIYVMDVISVMDVIYVMDVMDVTDVIYVMDVMDGKFLGGWWSGGMGFQEKMRNFGG